MEGDAGPWGAVPRVERGSGHGWRGLLQHLAIPGLPALVRKVPALRGPEGVSRAILTVGGAYGAACGQMRRLDRWGPAGTLIGQLVTYATAFRLIRSMLRNGPHFRERYADRAYQEAFYRYFLPAAGAIAASMAHICTAPGKRTLPRPLTLLPGLYLLATGLGLWWKSIHTLGFDTAALVYVYFPEEGRQITWSSYRVLRHPLYAAVSRFVLGLALIRGKLRGLALGGMVLVWFHLMIRLEEGELLRRFGRSYEEYREQTPAIIPGSLERERRLLEVIVGGRHEA